MPPSFARVLFITLAACTFVPTVAWVVMTAFDIALALMGIDCEMPFGVAVTLVVLGVLLLLLRIALDGQ